MINRSFHKIIRSPILWLTAALVMALALGFPHAASADPPENSQELHLGETINAVIETPGQTIYFSFTPETSDSYILYAESESSLHAFYTVVAGTCASSDKSIELQRDCTAGTTYYYGLRYQNSSVTGTIPVTIGLAPVFRWEVDENDVLTVSGRGEMNNYYWGDHPWSNTIKKVIIEDGITSIGNYAFFDCSSLTSIEIPEGVTSIGESAFHGCSNLSSIEIPEGVTSIGEWAFFGCSSLTSIEIPEGVTSIGHYTFCECGSLANIEIPEGITSIDSYAFCGCRSLESIKIPDRVTSIGERAFSDCYNLKNIVIPEGVNSIGEGAFSSCCNLISIEIPNGVTSIEERTFFNCNSLTSIRIPDGVTSIGERAFAACYSLTSITIPEDVASIGEKAFSGCFVMRKICFLGMNTEIADVKADGMPEVYCYKNSTAQAWAKNKGLSVILLDGKDPLNFLTVSIPQSMEVTICRQTAIPKYIFNTSPINSISWVSSNENILTVDKSGFITPVHTGMARVTLTVNGKSASSIITVCPLATELLVPEETLYAVMGGENCFSVYAEPRNAKIDPRCQFTDPTYGSVSTDFEEDLEVRSFWINTEKIGDTTLIITDRYSGISKTVPIRITGSMPQSIAFEEREVSIRVGQTVKLNTIITLADSTRIRNHNAQFQAYSGNSATIDWIRGKVTGIKPGTTVVQCWTSAENGVLLEAFCTVTVTKATEMVIPQDLNEIKPETFAGTDAMTYIIQPGGSTTTIRERAFADLACDAVSVHIPQSVTTIEDRAFEGCISVTIYGTPGSKAEEYANSHYNCLFIPE